MNIEPGYRCEAETTNEERTGEMIDPTKLKPGDKVRVREDAPNNTHYETPNWCKGMDYLRGQIVSVMKLDSPVVLVQDSNANWWNFIPSWLDPIDPPAPQRVEVVTRKVQRFNPGDTIRMPHYDTVGKGAYRVWHIMGVHLGATYQEGTYAMIPVDIAENEIINVPCIILETHPEIEKL